MRDNICEWNLLFTLCSLIQNVEARWEMSLVSIKPIVLLGCWCFVNGFYAVHAVLRLGPFHWVSRIWGILLLHSSSIFFNLPHPTLPSFFTPAPGDPSQIKAGEVNKSKPCQTHWLTHQKFPWLRYTLCLPSLPTNLARSEGSPIIHASQSVLNQPLIKREHVERCRAKQPPTPPSPCPIHSTNLESNKRGEGEEGWRWGGGVLDLFVFSSLSFVPIKQRILFCSVLGPSFRSRPQMGITNLTFQSFSNFFFSPSFSLLPFSCFCYECPPGVGEWIKHQGVGGKGTAFPEWIECREGCLGGGEQQWRWQQMASLGGPGAHGAEFDLYHTPFTTCTNFFSQFLSLTFILLIAFFTLWSSRASPAVSVSLYKIKLCRFQRDEV